MACNQAWATGARTFSMAQAWRPTVGTPLSSNVRPHKSPCGNLRVGEI
jgi:hypothetical protein